MNTGFVKNITIARFTGGGKTFVIVYIVIYSHSKGLTVITVAMMWHLAIQLGGWHWHKLLCVPVDRGKIMYVYLMTKLAIQKLERFPNRIEFIWSIYMIANGKISQLLPKLIMWLTIFSKFFAVWMFKKETNFFLQHMTQHSSNLL